MRTLLGDQPGAGAAGGDHPHGGGGAPEVATPTPAGEDTPSVTEFNPPPPPRPPSGGGAASANGARERHLPSVAPDPQPGHRRSRFDPDAAIVLYNEQHADYLLVKDDEPALFDYLATLIAKEYVVYNNPRAQSDDLAEELVRMLTRVRRHLPARVRRR
jgi:hypothetical protein